MLISVLIFYASEIKSINIKLLSNDIYDKITSKSETTVGRVIKKLYKDEFKDHEIGEFVEMYKALRKSFKYV